MKKTSKYSLVEERIVIATRIFGLLFVIVKFGLASHELFNVAFNYQSTSHREANGG